MRTSAGVRQLSGARPVDWAEDHVVSRMGATSGRADTAPLAFPERPTIGPPVTIHCGRVPPPSGDGRAPAPGRKSTVASDGALTRAVPNEDSGRTTAPNVNDVLLAATRKELRGRKTEHGGRAVQIGGGQGPETCSPRPRPVPYRRGHLACIRGYSWKVPTTTGSENIKAVRSR